MRQLSGLLVGVLFLLGPAAIAAPKRQGSTGSGASAAEAPADSASKPAQDAPLDPPIEPPVMAPFTGPASSRPLPPPAPLPDEGTPSSDASPEGGSIEESLRQFQAEAVVSSAAKREQRLKDVPMSVSWIPSEELEGTGQFTLCDAIQYFPGMECRHGAMRKAAVSAEGLGSNFLSNRLLLLKDGRPETDPWTGIFYPDETTPLTNVKQLEVIRGPGSSLYGSSAFSGVINVISRTPDDLMKEGRNYGADLRLLAGQDNTYRAQATVAGALGPVKALVNYYGLSSDGPQLLNNPNATQGSSPSSPTTPGATGQVDTQEWSKVNQVSGQVWMGPLRLDAEYTNSNIGRPGGEQISQVGNCGRCHYTPNDSEHVENLNLNAQADVKVADWLRLFGEGYAFFKRREVDLQNQITGDLQPSLGKRRRIGGEARALFTFGSLTATLGGDIKRDLINNQNVLPGLTDFDTQETIVGTYVDAEYRPLPNLAIGGGLRYDYYHIPQNVWQAQSSQLSPRASIVYHLTPQLTLRTNYGHAFRAPTFAELAINQQMYASTLLGNPELKAETLDTVEAAVDVWPAGGAVRLSATGFYKMASNLINQEFLFGSTSQFQNIGNAQVTGVEAEAAAKVPQINSSFDLAYQYLNTLAMPAPGSDVPAGPLDYAPSSRIYFRGHTFLGNLALVDLYAVYVGPRYDPSLQILPDGTRGGRIQLPGYLVANARVSVNVYKGLSFSFLAQNLFNASYEESFGFPQPGLRLFGELKYVY